MPFSSGWGNWMMGSDANAGASYDFESTVNAGLGDAFRSVGTDAMGTLGAWIFDTGVPTILNNVVTMPANAVMHAGHPDWNGLSQTIFHRYRQRINWVTNSIPQTCVSFHDINNRVTAQITGNGLAFQLYKVVGGVPTQLASQAVALVSGTNYWIDLISNGDGTYYAALYSDNAGAIGAQIVGTGNQAAPDAPVSGYIALVNNSATAFTAGGAFTNVCRVTSPYPINWNPNIQNGNWGTAGEPAFCWSANHAYGSGSRSLSINRVAGGSTGFAQLAFAALSGMPVTPGRLYGYSAQAFWVGAAGNASLSAIQFYQSGGAFISSIGAATAYAGSGGWAPIGPFAGPAPAGAAFVAPIAASLPAGTTGVFYVDSITVYQRDWFQAWSETPPQEAVIG